MHLHHRSSYVTMPKKGGKAKDAKKAAKKAAKQQALQAEKARCAPPSNS